LRESNLVLTVALSLLFLNLLIIGVEWQNLRLEKESAIVAAEEQARRVSGALAGTAVVFLQKSDLVMNMATQLYLSVRLTGEAINQGQLAAMLKGVKRQGGCGVCAFGILNEAGGKVFDFGSDPKALAELAEEVRALDGGWAAQRVSPVLQDGRTRAVLVVRRILLPSGQPGGVVYARLDLEHLRESLPGGELGQSGGAYLLSDLDSLPVVKISGDGGEGVVRAFLDAHRSLVMTRDRNQAASLHHGGQADGAKHILAWHGIDGYPLLAAVALVDTDYLARWRAHWALSQRYLLLLFGISLLSVIAVYWKSRRSPAYKARNGEYPDVDLHGASGMHSLHLPLEQKIELARQQRKTLAVCHLNIDDFDSVNTRHGRKTGDRLLVRLGDFLRQELRHEDMVVHLGGDEFVLVFSLLDDHAASERALNRLMVSFASPIELGEVSLSLSASIGVSIFPADDNDAATLLRHAGQAMYRAKQAGGNRFTYFDPIADINEKGRRHVIAQVRKGIERGEFRLHYQPKVDIAQGVVVGFEALIRWQHPEDGLLSPAHFLPMIEDDDLIVDLGYWTLQAALADLALWHRAGHTFGVSVNMATRHLQFPGFAERLREMLAGYPELPKWALELEILETTNMADLASAAEVLGQCLELGVAFALDDFGTGYSSLTYFRKLPVQTLKIDQTFVRDMLSDPEDLAIVEGLVLLGRSFSRITVAEGVEDIETAMLLKALGCTILQGYGIARPMPVERIFPWLREWPDARWLRARDRQIGEEMVPLIVAEGHHRAWTKKLVACLDGNPEVTPELDPKLCHVGRWCFHNVLDGVTDTPLCEGNRQLHEELHEQAAEMLALLDGGKGDEARAMLSEFMRKSEMLNDCLRALRLKILGVEQFPSVSEKNHV